MGQLTLKPIEPVSVASGLHSFVEPARPDMLPIVALHRGNDGYVSFHRKRGDEFEDLWSIKADQLIGLFPDLAPELDEDSFYSVNSFYRGNRNKSPIPDAAGERHQAAFRQGQGLRWLTACFADIDCKNLGLEVGTVIGSVINAQDRGELPPASIITRSGKGVWLFWILKSEQSSGPVRAWKENVRLYCNVQRAIGDRLVRLGADAQARDVARVTRIAGSVNTKAAVRVAYWLQADQQGKAFQYPLSSLAEAFGVELPKPVPYLERAVSKLSERGQRGQRGRWLKARDNFRRLWELRGQFKVGTRAAAVYVYTVILKSLTGDLKLTDEDVASELMRLWASLEQPPGDRYSIRDLKASSKLEGFKFGGIRNQRITDLLNITPAESKLLDNWPPASVFGQVQPEQKLSRTEEASRRQKWIAEIIAKRGAVPTGEVLVECLAIVGIGAVVQTVLKDLDVLGYENPRSKARLKAKRLKQYKKSHPKLFTD